MKLALFAAGALVVGLALAAPTHAVPGTTISGDGTYRVGVDIQPGVYRSQGGSGCYWARLSGFSGGLGDVIANNFGAGPQVVQIAATDAAFSTSGCSTWTLASAAGGAAPAPAPGTATGLPPGAQPCPSTGGPGGFAHSAIGSSKTSCPFAEQVRVAYGASGPPSATPRQITAGSPVTGDSYSVTCAANGPLVTCTGGDYAIVNCLDFPSLTSPSIQLGVPSLVGAAALLVGGRDPRGGKFIMKRRGSGAKRKTEPDPRSFRVTTLGGYPSLLWSGLTTPRSHFKASRGRVGAPRVWRKERTHP
jgi:hypothetical protein